MSEEGDFIVQKSIHLCIFIISTHANISEQLGNNEILVCINRDTRIFSTDCPLYSNSLTNFFLYGRLRHWSPRKIFLCKNSPRNARDVMSVHWVGKVLLKNSFICSIKFKVTKLVLVHFPASSACIRICF